MVWKGNTQLKGKHNTIACWCEMEGCTHWQMIWISEHFEKPSEHIADRLLYEIGWERVVENNQEHWLCSDCLLVYYSEKPTQPLQVYQATGRVHLIEENAGGALREYSNYESADNQ